MGIATIACSSESRSHLPRLKAPAAWLGLLVLFQVGPGPFAQPLPERVTVKGRVLDRETGKPTANAAAMLCLLNDKGESTGRTLPVAGMSGTPADPEGNFVIQGVPEGEYYLSIKVNRSQLHGERVTVSPQAPLNFDGKLQPVKSDHFAFRVLGLEGEPLGEKKVYLAMMVNGKLHNSRCKSDKQGYCRLPCACKPSRALATVPGVGSGDIDVDPEKPFDPELPIRLQKAATVTGLVKDKNTGQPAARLLVAMTSVGGQEKRPGIVPYPAIRARTGKDGRFTMKNVPPGICEVQVQDPRSLQSEILKPQLAPGQEGTGVDFVVSLAPKFRGTLLGVSGRPIATVPKATLTVWARQADGTFQNVSVDVGISPTGVFQTYGKALGQTTLGMSVPNEGWGTSPCVEASAGGDHQTEIRLKPYLRLTGKVVEEGTGRPLAGATVKVTRVKNAEPTLAAAAEANTNYQGEFVIENLVPSAYTLSASSFGYDASEPIGVEIAEGRDVPEATVRLKKPKAVAE